MLLLHSKYMTGAGAYVGCKLIGSLQNQDIYTYFRFFPFSKTRIHCSNFRGKKPPSGELLVLCRSS